jgi:N-formylmaleamate deformylase
MGDWVTGRCQANGTEHHYIRTGGDKPPIVLLHGLTANGACWTPLARALESDYDVVMPDARGHGHSGASPDEYRYEQLALDVVGLMDALGLTGPVLLGHSMGGMTAAVVASRNPRALGGVVLVDPTFLTPERQREVYESDVAEQHRRTLGREKEELLAEAGRRHKRRSPEIIELIVDARLRTDIRAFDVLTPPNPDFRQLIKSLAIPSLLVVGDVGALAGAVVSPELAAELTQLNPRLNVESIVEAGHGIPYDQPERLAAVVRAFLSTLEPRLRPCSARTPPRSQPSCAS